MLEKRNDILHLHEQDGETLSNAPVKVIRECTSHMTLQLLENDGDREGIADDIILALEESKKLAEEKLINIPQTDRNFEIITEMKGKSLEIILKHKISGEEFDMSTLFPNDWYNFVPSSLDCYFKSAFSVGINLNNIDFRGFILTILHEIGHSHQEKTSKMGMFLTMGLRAFAFSKLGVWIQKILNTKKVMIEEDIILEAEKQSYKERNAWAFALIQAKKIEKLGFNVFDGYTSVKEIFDQIGWHLMSYDECLFYDILDTFGDITPENIGELQDALDNRPLFNKKTKNLYQIHTQ